MADLSKIKSKKLKKLIEESVKFGALSEEEQEKRLQEMANLSAKQQEKLFCPFFEKENAKEAEQMQDIDENQQKAIMELMLQIDEMDKRIDKLEKEDRENFGKEEDVKEQARLLKKLENL